MKSVLTSLYRNTRGTTTIEYGMLCGMIVLVIIVAVRNLGNENGGAWGAVSSKATAAMSAAN
ncbi:MAG: Flp family type IVb pilin [Novosphingobium sp.]